MPGPLTSDSEAERSITGGIRTRRALRIGVLLVGAFAVFPAPALADQAATATDEKTLATLCGVVETAARREGLPVNYFTRLIWRESAFQSDAVSPAGAEGVAQFMPRAASEQGLADPFDPAAAIHASAKLLAALTQRFGNLGLAAAAYNAGSNALTDWLAGRAVLPVETQDYVLAVTGRGVEEWRGANPPSYAAPDADKPCLTSIENLSEGAQIPMGFSQSSALRPSFGAQHANFNAVGHMQLLRLAADAHMTPSAYVLFALKDSGLDVKGDHPRKARTK